MEASSISWVNKHEESIVIYNNDIAEAVNVFAAIIVPSVIRPNIE
jgi:hypothetical protein